MKYFIIMAFLLISMPVMAINYADKAHDAYEEKQYLKAGELYEKAFESDKNKVYLENAAAAYLTLAFNLSNDKDYEKAIALCEKVLLLRPESTPALELLGEIYYSRGSDYYFNGFSEKARNDMEKALRCSVSPEQKQRVLEELKDWKIESY